MIENNFILNGRKYALGGLVNGEIDGMLLSNDGESDIYDIFLDNKSLISLSDKYGLFIGHAHAISAKEILAQDEVLLVNNTKAKVLKVIKRRGISINLPREFFSLNDVLVSKNHVPRTPWTQPKKTLENKTPVNSEVTSK